MLTVNFSLMRQVFLYYFFPCKCFVYTCADNDIFCKWIYLNCRRAVMNSRWKKKVWKRLEQGLNPWLSLVIQVLCCTNCAAKVHCQQINFWVQNIRICKKKSKSIWTECEIKDHVFELWHKWMLHERSLLWMQLKQLW